METLKTCIYCGRSLPATEDYFGFYTSNGKKYMSNRCKECNRAKAKEWAQNNRDKYLQRQKAYREAHKEERAASGRKRRSDSETHEKDLAKKREHYQKNKKRIMEYIRQYKASHPGYEAKQRQTRRAIKKSLPCSFTPEQWAEAKKEFDYCCAYCGEKTRLDQEHFIPVVKGGGYTKNNILPSCIKCNSSKNDSDFSAWYPKQPFYSEEREKHILKYLGRAS